MNVTRSKKRFERKINSSQIFNFSGMRMPPPEILAQMIPPELANRMAGSAGPPTAEMLAGMIPPEMAANMPGLKGMLPPEIANRMPMPELPGFLANRPPGKEICSNLVFCVTVQIF